MRLLYASSHIAPIDTGMANGRPVCATLRLALVLAISLLPVGAQAAEFGLSLNFPESGEWHPTSYRCDGQSERLPVAYLNAAPNFLAILPVDGKSMVFVSVLADSGVRYAAGKYEWRTKGAEAGLYDLTRDPAGPAVLTCLEAIDTP